MVGLMVNDLYSIIGTTATCNDDKNLVKNLLRQIYTFTFTAYEEQMAQDS